MREPSARLPPTGRHRSSYTRLPQGMRTTTRIPQIHKPMDAAACEVESTVPAAALPIQIWLVDDDDRIRSLVSDWLERFENIRCTRDFNSPNAVLSALASKPGPDLILLDIQMGEQNGLDAVRPIRSLSRSTRVVMFTSCFDARRRQRAMADGASDFLLKYTPLEEVAARIRELAGQPAPKVRRRTSASPCTRIQSGCEPRRSRFSLSQGDTAATGSRQDSPRPRRSFKRYFDFFRGAHG